MLLKNIVRQILIEGDARNPDLMDDPIKRGNVFVFHGTRKPSSITKYGIKAQTAGVIRKDVGNKVFAAHNPQTASWKTKYEEDLKTQYGKEIYKGNRFIIIASVPKSDTHINPKNGDIEIWRDVEPDEIIASYPDVQSREGFKVIPHYLKKEYGDFVNDMWTKLVIPKKRIGEGWGGILQAQFYWVDKNGRGFNVSSHGIYAAKLSGFGPTEDEAYNWMFAKGWMQVSVEDGCLYLNTSLKTGVPVNLTKGQREWVKNMRDEKRLHPTDYDGRKIEI